MKKPEWYCPQEFARACGLTLHAVKQAIANGEIRVLDPAAYRKRIPADELARFSGETPAPPPLDIGDLVRAVVREELVRLFDRMTAPLMEGGPHGTPADRTDRRDRRDRLRVVRG